jgi:hypothetical protein
MSTQIILEQNLLIRYEKVLLENKTTAVERQSNAEVLTPISLVEEMLNKLPNTFWSNYKYIRF